MKEIRRLNPGEGNLYKEARLESLRESPEAFASTYDDALSRDMDSWCAQADSSAAGWHRATYIIKGSKPLGLAAIYRDDEFPSEGELIQMWVAPELRGVGTAEKLLDELFIWAGMNEFSTIRAEVYKANTKALRFYERFGFLLSPKHDSESTVTLIKVVERADRGVPAGWEMSAIDIRPLRQSDCEKIGPMLREIWLDAYHGIQTDEELLAQSHKVHTPAQIAEEVDNSNIHSIVAVNNDRIIGHARSDLNDGVVDIVRLYVLREFYGQGIGKSLLGVVDSYFDPRYEVWLDVFEDNKRAVNFYLSQGYQIMKRATEVQTEGRDVFEYKMRKQRIDG